MPARSTSRHHASALLPAVLLSVALAAPVGGAAAPTAAPAPPQEPEEGVTTPVPTEVLEAPAGRRGVLAGPREHRALGTKVSAASATGIPTAALSAYQRAQTVINAADKTCNIDWQLIAAIGRVESDHGRYGDNVLDQEGVSRPGIYGIPLDGTRNTAVIRDTDAGQYDNDTKWDRAVGPMQFIPSTWAVVGVDGDNDGKRDPQDIDDAALATAVYLCSGNDDLATEKGRRVATFRYNHSHSYVDLVLSFMDAYLEGDFTSVQTGTVSYSGGFDRVRAAVDERPALHGAARRTQDERRERGRDERDRRNSDIVNPKGNGPKEEPEGPGQNPGGGGDGNEDLPDDDTPPPAEDDDTPPPAEDDDTPPPAEDDDETTPPVEDDDETTPPVEDDEDNAPLTEEQASAECLALVGATSEEELDALGVRDAYNGCMKGYGWPRP